MDARTQQDAARRWTKFPATVLFVSCLLWLVAVFPRAAADWRSAVAEPAETFLGALSVFTQLVIVPIGSPLAAIGMLFLQRSAMYLGIFLPFVPLGVITGEKLVRIAGKFREYRSLGTVTSFGDGVLDGAILIGLWVIAIVHVLYIRKALQELGKADEWKSGGRGAGGGPTSTATTVGAQTRKLVPGAVAAQSANGSSATDDTCFLLPDSVAADDED